MVDEHPLSLPVIALVTSAGGLNALSDVLGALPAHLPAAVIVVQHLDPDHTSSLATILDGRTAAILDQERSSLFTQQVGNIPPHTEVVAELTIVNAVEPISPKTMAADSCA